MQTIQHKQKKFHVTFVCPKTDDSILQILKLEATVGQTASVYNSVQLVEYQQIQ